MRLLGDCDNVERLWKFLMNVKKEGMITVPGRRWKAMILFGRVGIIKVKKGKFFDFDFEAFYWGFFSMSPVGS